MPTRLYFRDDAHSLTGTFPVTEQSTAVANWTANNTLKTLELTTGTAMVSHTGTSAATTAAQSGMMGRFVTMPLSGAQTVGGSPMVMNVAESEGNLASNFWVNAIHVFVWRPSTGALVGTVVDSGGTSLGGLEPTAAASTQVSHITGIATSAVSAETGDVVIIEVWSRFTQSMGTAYSSSFFFGGSVENTTENAVVSNHASYVEFAENLVLTKTVSLSGSVTGTATVPAAPISNTPKSYELVGVASGVSSFTMPSGSAIGDVALAIGFRDGSTTAPSLPSGWTSLGTQVGTTASALLAYKVLAGGDATSFANATAVVCNVYRNLDPITPIGTITSTFGTGTSVTLPATPYISKNSAVAAFVGHSSPDVEYPSNNMFGGTFSMGVGSVQSLAYTTALSVVTQTSASIPRYSTNNGQTWAGGSTSYNSVNVVYFAPFGGFIGIYTASNLNYITSPDGITWTVRALDNTVNSTRPIIANNTLFLFSQGATNARYTTNGTSWQPITIPTGGNWVSVAYGNSVYCSVSPVNAQGTMTSSDGNTWTYTGSSQPWHRVVYFGGRFVAIGINGTNVIIGESSTGSSFNITTTISGLNPYYYSGQFANSEFAVFFLASTTGSLIMIYSFGDAWYTSVAGLNSGGEVNISTVVGKSFLVPLFDNSQGTYVVRQVTLTKNQIMRRTAYADATNAAASYDTGGTLG